MIISCPRCGLAFETQATTNTRCRRCRHVVRVGQSSARAAAPAEPELDTYPDAGGILLVIAAGLMLLAVVVPAIARAIRRRHADTAPTAAPDGAVASTWPPQATAGHTGDTAANTGPNSADTDSAA